MEKDFNKRKHQQIEKLVFEELDRINAMPGKVLFHPITVLFIGDTVKISGIHGTGYLITDNEDRISIKSSVLDFHYKVKILNRLKEIKLPALIAPESLENNLSISYTMEEIGRLADIYLLTLDDVHQKEYWETKRDISNIGVRGFANWLFLEDRKPLLSC